MRVNRVKFELNQFLFANDAALMGGSKGLFQLLVCMFDFVCERRKIKVSVNKSKIM